MSPENKNYLNDINEIRSMMEQSSRFLSLSGLSGIFAGTWALIGAGIAHSLLQQYKAEIAITEYCSSGEVQFQYLGKFFLLAIGTIILALASGTYFTTKKAKENNQSIWSATAMRLMINLFIPLTCGGIFSFALIYHGVYGLVAPAMLVFYGLSLLNASKYTLSDIRTLGIAQLILGCTNAFFIGYGLYFWAFGFGVLHIIYGIIMYNKYERN